jgi:DNA-binding TFAR19-related protein (PDSD5 family)
LSKK